MLTESSKSSIRSDLSEGRFVDAFRWMVLGRVLDEKTASLYRAGKIAGGAFLGLGQEALSVSQALPLNSGDVYAPLIRDAAGRLAFGESPEEAFQAWLGSRLGPMRGRDGNVHRGRPKDGYLPMISHLGGTLSVVNGMLMARRMDGKKDFVGMASIGEGGTSTGAFHEALNQAAVEKLPLVLVVADNQFAYSTPKDRQFACDSLADRAKGYGIQSTTVNGNTLVDCLPALEQVVQDAREGGGPQMVVASLLRLCGHGEHDDASYIPEEMKGSDLARDCIELAGDHILEQGWKTPDELSTVWDEARARVDDAVKEVKTEPTPDAENEVWCALSTSHLRDDFAGGEVKAESRADEGAVKLTP